MSAETKAAVTVAEWVSKLTGKGATLKEAKLAAERATRLERSSQELAGFAEAGLRRGVHPAPIDPDELARMSRVDALGEDYADARPWARAEDVPPPAPDTPEIYRAMEHRPMPEARPAYEMGDDGQYLREAWDRTIQREDTPEMEHIVRATGLDAQDPVHGLYHNDAFTWIADVAAHQGELGRYAARMDVDEAGSLVKLFLDPDKQLPVGAFEANSPIVITGREQGKGVFKVTHVAGPVELAARKAPAHWRTAEIPVVLQNETGGPIKDPIRVMLTEAGDEPHTWGAPRGEGLVGERFSDPMYPDWFKAQPETQQEAHQAVKTLFSPEGQMVMGALSDHLSVDSALMKADEVWKTIRNIFRNPGRLATDYFGGKGSTIPGRKVDSLWTGEAATEMVHPVRGSQAQLWKLYQEERKVEMQKAQLSFYNTVSKKDPTILEKMRVFSRGTPYTLGNTIGVTDPKLRDLPLLFFHTDQEFLNANRATRLAQFESSAEGGIHLGSDPRQAHHLLQEDTAGPAMMEWIDQAWKRFEAGKENLHQLADMMWGSTVSSKELDDIIAMQHNYGLRFSNMDNEIRLESMREKKNNVLKMAFTRKHPELEKDEIRMWFESLLTDVTDVDTAIKQTAQSAMIFRGKRPLILWDEQSFDVSTIARKLLKIPLFHDRQAALQLIADQQYHHKSFRGIVEGTLHGVPIDQKLGNEAKFSGTKGNDFLNYDAATRALHTIIEEHGFDHILYPNAVEEVGMPSIIVWKEEHLKFSWAPFFDRGNPSMNYATLPGLGLLEYFRSDDNGK